MKPRLRAPILLRDLRRKGRRFSLRFIRAALVGWFVLMLVYMLVYMLVMGLDGSNVQDDISTLAEVFWWSSATLCFVLATALVPLEVGYAVVSEREEGTLELLTLVGLPPGRVLFEIVGARILHLLLLFLSLIPIFYLGLSLGGVAPGQVVVFGVMLVAYVWILLGVSSLIATATRAVVLPMLITVAWVVIFNVLVPIRFFGQSMNSTAAGFWQSEGLYLPIAPIYTSQPWSLPSMLGLALWLLAGFIAFAVAQWRFRRVTAQGWSWRSKAWPGLRAGWLLPVLIIAGGWALVELGEARVSEFLLRSGLPDISFLPWVDMIYLVVWPLSHGMYLRTAAWLLPRLDRSAERRFGAGPVLIRFVGPLLWRELFTTAQGGLSRVLWAITIGWVLVAILLGVVGYPSLEGVTLWSLAGLLVGWVLLSVLISSSVIDERQRRGLPLLTLSAVESYRLVGVKVLAGLIRGGSLVVLPYLGLVGTFIYSRFGVRNLAHDSHAMVSISWLLTGGALWALAATLVFSGAAAALAFGAGRLSVGRTVPPLFVLLFFPAIFLFVLALTCLVPGLPTDTFFLFLPVAPPTGRSGDLMLAVVGVLTWLGIAVGTFGLANYLANRRMEGGKP